MDESALQKLYAKDYSILVVRRQRCGWLKDKFGVSWQVIPPILDELLNDPDVARSQRAMQAMLQMDKIEIETLKQAVEQ